MPTHLDERAIVLKYLREELARHRDLLVDAVSLFRMIQRDNALHCDTSFEREIKGFLEKAAA